MKAADRVFLGQLLALAARHRPRGVTIAAAMSATGRGGTAREAVLAMQPAVDAERLQRTLHDGIWHYTPGPRAAEPMPDGDEPVVAAPMPSPTARSAPPPTSGRVVAGVQIDAGVPLPKRIVRGVKSCWRLAAEQLQPGESFGLPMDAMKSVKAAVLRLHSQTDGARYLIRRVDDQSARCWRTQ